LTNGEIATVLNISIKTVETQISIAFSKIRKDLNID
jgi:DNA-binding CsgD family transcriptional regulator